MLNLLTSLRVLPLISSKEVVSSPSLGVYLGDIFLSAFHAILSSSGAIFKCLKIE